MIVHAFDSNQFGPVAGELLSGDRLPELGPGSANESVRGKLQALTLEKLFPAGVRDRDMAVACIAALWLHHDFLDQSHQISQEIETPTGSYWHGIMHRREPDYSNAKYWFRRIGSHAALPEIAAAVAPLPIPSRMINKAWKPLAFVDWVEECAGKGDASELLCRQVQRIEWQILLAWCWKQAAK